MFRVSLVRTIGAVCVGLLSMGAAFTVPVAGDSSVSLITVNELHRAQRERSEAQDAWRVMHPNYEKPDVVEGGEAHEASEWGGPPSTALQTNLLYLLTGFVNHSVALTNTNTVVMWTVPAWQDETGLTNNGIFRRLTNTADIGTGNWSYGIAQEGDIVGTWIWEDLQVGYSPLKWTTLDMDVASGYYGSDQQERDASEYNSYPYTDDCSEVWAAFETEWDNDAWTLESFSPGSAYSVWVSSCTATNNERFSAKRGAAAIFTSSSRSKYFPTNLSYSADVYWLPKHVSTSPFIDIDSNGMVDDKYWLYTNLVSLTTNRIYLAANTNRWSQNPVELMGWDCGESIDPETNVYIRVRDGRFILKWDFSNSD